MMEDRELDNWRQQWSSLAEPLPNIQQKIKHQNLRFVLSNLLAAVAFVAGIIYAILIERMQPSLGRGWTLAICVLILACTGYRLWVQRKTWRAETHSSRAFVELWRRRVMARLKMLSMAHYVIPTWVAFCAVLVAANWTTIGPDVRAHPAVWVGQLTASVVVLPAIFLLLAWYRRRKLAELDEIKRILEEMKD
jgi:hypothetical protein